LAAQAAAQCGKTEIMDLLKDVFIHEKLTLVSGLTHSQFLCNHKAGKTFLPYHWPSKLSSVDDEFIFETDQEDRHSEEDDEEMFSGSEELEESELEYSE
jgi:hypothetical protein